ncbi:hypothetical protein ACP70R_041108 [Stipagrostis hirtigluma subsp. patula]
MIFAPAFFDLMVHLAVHLPQQARLVGPVQFRWMFFVERFLGTLKSMVSNRAHPEGSIVESFTKKECSTYCSMYLREIETRFNREERNYDGERQRIDRFSMAPGQRIRPRRNSSEAQGQHGTTALGASAAEKKVRGINKGKGLERLIKKAGHPLDIYISEERRPVGENNELLSREIGFLTRYHAPIRRTGWKNLDEADRLPLYELLKLKFNLDLTEPWVKGCVDLLFSSCYKGFRHKCYNHYLLHGGGDNAKSNPYKPFAQRVDDWIWFCDYFETNEFKKLSANGKANRSNLPYVHRKGTRSFVALQHELGCGEIALYKECYSRQGEWASTDARDNHEQMVDMQQQPLQEGEAPLIEPQICEAVLGKAYGYIRGRGHGPKPNRRGSSSSSSSAQQALEEELAAAKLIVATQQATIETQQAKIDHQDKRIDWLTNVMCKMAGISPPAMDDIGVVGPVSRDAPSTSSDGQVLWSLTESRGGDTSRFL